MYARFSEVELVVVECAIAKVCSMLGVGPKIKLDVGFDLVCYRDCIEFFMERCEPVAEHWEEEVSVERLKYCLAVMHQQRLIHRDVKPGNIVWSCSQMELVYCDFGVSCTVIEEVGQKTLTDRQGTQRYMIAEQREMART